MSSPAVANMELSPAANRSSASATGTGNVGTSFVGNTTDTAVAVTVSASTLSPTVECIVCLEDVPREQRAAQRCGHDVCHDCFGKYLRVAITDSCVAFPRCPHPNCNAAASEQLVNKHTDDDITSRMRYLRGLHPARAKDGRRMWCVASGCYEPLAPAVVDPNAPAGDDGPPPTSACGKCGTIACLRCGGPAHTGACVAPTICLRQQRMYAEYAVGRIASCPTCGTHVERNGGCDSMTCIRCRRSFNFRPFQNIRQVQESIALSAGVVPPPPAPRRHAALAHLMAIRRDRRLARANGNAEFGDPYMRRRGRNFMHQDVGARRRARLEQRLEQREPPLGIAALYRAARARAVDDERVNERVARNDPIARGPPARDVAILPPAIIDDLISDDEDFPIFDDYINEIDNIFRGGRRLGHQAPREPVVEPAVEPAAEPRHAARVLGRWAPAHRRAVYPPRPMHNRLARLLMEEDEFGHYGDHRIDMVPPTAMPYVPRPPVVQMLQEREADNAPEEVGANRTVLRRRTLSDIDAPVNQGPAVRRRTIGAPAAALGEGSLRDRPGRVTFAPVERARDEIARREARYEANRRAARAFRARAASRREQ